MQSIENTIIKRIRGKGRGRAYTSKDFLDLGTRASVDKSLSRLAAKEIIRRLKPGLYDYPKINDKLGGVLSPVIEEVAKAIARKNNIRILISGALAVNKLGLSTQVPAKIVFLTDGRDRKLKIYNQSLIFRHASPKNMAICGKKSELILQAIRYLGKQSVDSDVIYRLNKILTDKDKKHLRIDSRQAPEWVGSVVNKIIGENK
ncbi:MAG: DUF6088 family protein [Candidatus Zapsychrus exili]|nr:DUF6088 family protein [Candidatus Zapsychrus exili]